MSSVKLEYSEKTLVAGILVSFFLGCILGFVVYHNISIPVEKFKQAKEQCEQNLPRSQHCIVEYVGKPVKEIE